MSNRLPVPTRTALVLGALLSLAPTASAQELLYVSEGNRLRRLDLATLDGPGPVLEDLVFDSVEGDPVSGRDINGMLCLIPDGSGQLIAGEDSGQPRPPAGWGVLTADGRQVGKLTPTVLSDFAEPYGCAFDAEGRLFTSEVGRKFFGSPNGQLILWFPPFDRFPGDPGEYPDSDAVSDGYCKLANDIGTAGGVAVDATGRVYVAAASGMEVLRFSPPFPTSPDAEGGCGGRDATGAPVADRVQRERLLGPLPSQGMLTYAGLAMAPNGNLYAASVLTGRIAEFDLEGGFVRTILAPPDWLPPHPTGHPQGLAVDSAGTLYYADLALEFGLSGIGPGPDGKIWRIRFDSQGEPLPPELLLAGLAFPDGVSVLPGDLQGRADAGALRPPPAPGPAPENATTASSGRLLATLAVLAALLLAGRLSRD